MDPLEKARNVINLEICELRRLHDRLDRRFADAVHTLRSILEKRGKIVVVGVGKSGDIGRKIAATLNSTGATAVVLNSQDALHGDLGVVAGGDAVIAMSQSGETRELLALLPHLRRRARTIIAITGAGDSTLARNADTVLDAHVEREACPLNLAPTASSTVMLVLGDALAMVLLEARGFKADDFALLHPGGSLGRALLTKVSHIMRTGSRLPLVPTTATVHDALASMSTARAGAAVIILPDGTLAGIFTQGDFARAFQSEANIANRPVTEFMTPDPVTIESNKLAAEVLTLLERHPIDDLVVINLQNKVVGLVDSQDLSREKIL